MWGEAHRQGHRRLSQYVRCVCVCLLWCVCMQVGVTCWYLLFVVAFSKRINSEKSEKFLAWREEKTTNVDFAPTTTFLQWCQHIESSRQGRDAVPYVGSGRVISHQWKAKIYFWTGRVCVLQHVPEYARRFTGGALRSKERISKYHACLHFIHVFLLMALICHLWTF